MELLWNGGTKVCSNGRGHMTKIAAMPIYGKNLEKSFRKRMAEIIEIWYMYTVLDTRVCSNDDPRLTF